MSGYVLTGFVVGAVLIIVHLVRCRRLQVGPRLERAVEILLSSQGVTAGARVLVICLSVKKLNPFSEEDRVYIFIGGIALIWASVSSLAQDFGREPPPTSTNGAIATVAEEAPSE